MRNQCCGTIVAIAGCMPKQERRRLRGFSLFEVMITVAIIALISGAVGLAIYEYYFRAKVRLATSRAETIRSAVKARWHDAAAADCPDVRTMIEDGVLDENSPRSDPWDVPWRISCEGRKVTVRSNGPDRQPGTEDDIQVPRP